MERARHTQSGRGAPGDLRSAGTGGGPAIRSRRAAHRVVRLLFGLLLSWFVATAPAYAEAAKVVRVGAYVQSLHAMSLKDNSFTIDLYLWFRWDPSEWTPSDGQQPQLPFETFEIVGASELEKSVQQQSDGYAALRVKAHLTQFWDVARFPLDDHVLRVVVEDVASEVNLVRYEADEALSSVAPEFTVPGWKAQPLRVRSATHDYRTTFGDPKLARDTLSTYSQVAFEVPVVREGFGMFLKLFTGLLVSVAIAFVAFFVRATEVDPRFGLPVGALFAAIASEYVVTSTLPDSSAVTLADRLHLVSFLAILTVVVESARALHLLQSDRPGIEHTVRRLDRATFVVAATTWLTTVIVLTVGSAR